MKNIILLFIVLCAFSCTDIGYDFECTVDYMNPNALRTETQIFATKSRADDWCESWHKIEEYNILRCSCTKIPE